jgi:DNA-binding CsgD family transcriptional regulator
VSTFSSNPSPDFLSNFAPSLVPNTGSDFTPISMPNASPNLILQIAFEVMPQGVLVLNAQREIVQANSRARSFCKQLLQSPQSAQEPNHPTIPEAIWNLCRALLSSRQDDPEVLLIPEDEVEMDNQAHLKISARWLDPNDSEASYMIVTLEDRTETLRNLARWDAHRYGLTAREAEVWLLKCQGYSYDDIAAELYVSRNTVKKHLKTITLKREGALS